ncbi:hypothetical protein BCY91_07260 [Pelobium manganitolerans]|uniref:Methyltransferase type 11 n=1 Tax=Pelobium manganitolerans TaxID=1842495 RepID=A0A419S3Q7_9SPHI|nr:hypothetical protein [Pelobium manganitolerans]RKD14279.1 hypothetical protein BCY91_07260 [Pelobium manganitolerans]
MVEVYRTNVEQSEHANALLLQFNKLFPCYEVNFDLDDCDRILRVESNSTAIEVQEIISVLQDYGFSAEVLV